MTPLSSYFVNLRGQQNSAKSEETVCAVAPRCILAACRKSRASHWRHTKRLQSRRISSANGSISGTFTYFHILYKFTSFIILLLRFQVGQTCQFDIVFSLFRLCPGCLSQNWDSLEAEILAWLDENCSSNSSNSSAQPWLAIDDLPLELPAEHVVRTDPFAGPLNCASKHGVGVA